MCRAHKDSGSVCVTIKGLNPGSQQGLLNSHVEFAVTAPPLPPGVTEESLTTREERKKYDYGPVGLHGPYVQLKERSPFMEAAT